MTDTVKMPEPAVRQERWNYNHWGEIVNQAPDLTAFTEAQLKAYGDDRAREALEMAALKFEMQHTRLTNISAANFIRALAKELA